MWAFIIPSLSDVFRYTGGDIEARDFGRKLTPQEWALFTGRYETARLIGPTDGAAVRRTVLWLLHHGDAYAKRTGSYFKGAQVLLEEVLWVHL